MMNQLNLFVTPVWWEFIELDNKKMYEKIKEFEAKTETTFKSNLGGFQSATDRWDMMNEDNTFQPLRDKIIHNIKEMNFKAKSFEFARMWCNINRKGHWNMIHSHGHYDFSGVYYVKAPEDSGNFIVRDPRPAAISSEYMIESFNGGEVVRIAPEVGKLIIFPSYLDHMVEPSKSDDERVSISFNIKAIV